MIVLIVLLGFVYMAPTFVAARREHPQSGPIFIVNFFLGWTFVGWVGAMAWSCSTNRRAS